MKKHILTLLFILFTIISGGAVKKFEANPINVAVVIIEKEDNNEITKLFDYYGYTLQGTSDGYQIMKTSSGNEIRYSFTDTNDESKNTTVIVKTKATHKEIDNLLTELKFKKVGNIYERMIHRYNNQVTNCSFGPRNTLVLQRNSTPKAK